MKSRKELSQALARRYRSANRKGKTGILNEFVAATGYNRCYAAMLLRNYRRRRTLASADGSVGVVAEKQPRKAGGRPPVYGKQVEVALEKLWKRFGYLCGKRLVPVIRHALPFIAAHRGLNISSATCAALQTISAASVDRLLAAARKRLFLKGVSHTKAPGALSAAIPVRTFSEWDSVTPGHFQLDLVGHDGGIAKNSGISIDNSVRLTDAKSKESLAEYIARPPLSLKKIRYEPFKGKVLFHTKYSDYFGPTLALVENCAPL